MCIFFYVYMHISQLRFHKLHVRDIYDHSKFENKKLKSAEVYEVRLRTINIVSTIIQRGMQMPCVFDYH